MLATQELFLIVDINSLTHFQGLRRTREQHNAIMCIHAFGKPREATTLQIHFPPRMGISGYMPHYAAKGGYGEANLKEYPQQHFFVLFHLGEERMLNFFGP